MNNDSTFIIISTVLIASLMSICSALRSKKTEVDTVLKEYKSNQRGGKEMPTENNYHTLSDENHSEKPEMAESLSVDPEVLIDWDFLQSYSNDLDYQIGHFDFVISYISMPLYVSLIGHTFISKMSPDQFPNLKHYTFLGGLGSLPLNYEVQSMIEQKVGDKRYIKPFADLLTETDIKNPLLGSLEKKIVSAMSEPTRKARVAQYRWIKDYVKDHQISDLSLFNVYLEVLNIKEFGGIKCSERLTPSEAKLARAIGKMVSYVTVFVDEKSIK